MSIKNQPCMKKLLFLLFSILISIASYGQSIEKIAKETSPGWFKIKPSQFISAEQFISQAPTLLGLSKSELKILKIKNDDIGFKHYRLQQLHQTIPVEGGDFLLHELNGQLVSLNGELVFNLNINVQANISSSMAIQKALAFVKAKKYIWEDVENEVSLQDLHKNPHATYFPKPELVIAQKDFNKIPDDYKLAYKLDVYATEPLSRQDIYIDAQTGEILFTIDKIHTGDVPGVAHTKYSGQRNIISDSISPDQYRLRESTTGGGIETYNLLQTRDYSVAVDFTDSNNVWENVNPFQDEVATDAHWGAQTTYSYFLNEHNRDSYDDKGTKLLNYVHYGVDYANAFWDGQRMTYGDGNGNSFTALISLDIAAHEMTHGVTQNTAGLIYRDEWGALNESFSDIFAATTEAYGTPLSANYAVGELITSNGLGIRSMSNPKSFSDPDTYLGVNWYSGPLDNGGVHINSGVQNHWFYILVEGDSAQNDFGTVYDEPGIGMDKAGKIAYRNLAYYLTRTSEYFDARQGSIQAAEDLYGVCSPELLATVGAWRAVGVGDYLQDGDFILVDLLSPQTSCGLTNEAVSVLFRYYDCNDTIWAGDSIQLGFSVDSNIIDNGWFTIPQTMVAGDSMIFTFPTLVNLSQFTTYTIKTWLGHLSDLDQSNDTLFSTQITNSLQQNEDFAIVDLLSPNSACELTSNESVIINFKFRGCDSLVAGQTIDIGYSFNGNPIVSHTHTLSQTVHPEDVTEVSLPGNLDLSSKGVYDFDFWIKYSGDPDSSNDTIYHRIIQNPYPVGEHLYTFENRTYTQDSLYFKTTSDSRIDILSEAAEIDTLGLRFTGSNVYSHINDFLFFNRRNPFTINPSFSSLACACVDARNWDSVQVSFELKQTFSSSWAGILGYQERGVSSLRLTVDGIQIGETYQPITNRNDRFRLQEYDLTADYNHSQFELCLEARNYLAGEFDPSSNSVGDNAYVDNFRIFNNANVGLEENKHEILFELYPNPTKGKVKISIGDVHQSISSLDLINANGQLVKRIQLNILKEESNFEFDMSDLPKGIYLVTMGGYSQKLILK